VLYASVRDSASQFVTVCVFIQESSRTHGSLTLCYFVFLDRFRTTLWHSCRPLQPLRPRYTSNLPCRRPVSLDPAPLALGSLHGFLPELSLMSGDMEQSEERAALGEKLKHSRTGKIMDGPLYPIQDGAGKTSNGRTPRLKARKWVYSWAGVSQCLLPVPHSHSFLSDFLILFFRPRIRS